MVAANRGGDEQKVNRNKRQVRTWCSFVQKGITFTILADIRSTLYVMLEHAFLNVFRQFFLDISIMRVSGVPHTGTAAVL